MSAENAPTAGEYIVHHLTHLQNQPMAGVIDFSVFNLDSIFWGVSLGLIGSIVLWLAARKATAGVPGRFQAAVEILVEMVENQAKGIVHNANSRKLVAPLALVVFVWIFLLNAMDLLPVDLLPLIWEKIYGAAGHDPHHAYLRVVPTADLSVTMGLSLSVLILCLIYNVKIKGVGGWVHELFTAPFGSHPALYPVNFLMQIIEFVAKTVSHGMRLFGNMYAGELIFLLIALMGGAWSLTATGIGLAIVKALVERKQRLRDLLRSRKRLLVMTHKNPDPDSLGGAVGLQEFARLAAGIDSRSGTPVRGGKLVYGVEEVLLASPDLALCNECASLVVLDPDICLAELSQGQARLKALFGSRFLPVVVPPWNRFASSLIPSLATHGFIGISGGPSGFPNSGGTPLRQAHTTIDPIDWARRRNPTSHGIGVRPLAAIVDDILIPLENALGPQIPAPPFPQTAPPQIPMPPALGILTHHLVHETALWSFLDQLFLRLSRHPAVRFISASSLFPKN